MKQKEAQELHTKPTPELAKMLKEKRERLHTLRFDLAAGKVKNVAELWAVRKDIARILTVMNMKPREAGDAEGSKEH